MHNLYRVFVGTTAAVLASAALAGPASADPSPPGDTPVTFDVTAGELSITAPVSADVGSGPPEFGIGDQLGSVTVSDSRASLDASWTAGVSSTDFTTGAETDAERVGTSDLAYWSGPATASTGNGTFMPGQATAPDSVFLVAAQTPFIHAGGTGNNTATWNPTLTINVPLQNVAGTYTGTVTHSVS